MTAWADMYGWDEGRAAPANAEQQRQQDRAIALKDRNRQCDGLRQQLVAHANALIREVYQRSYDTADDGWVEHRSREIFLRDVKEEIVRAEEALRRISYGEVDVQRCVEVAGRYRAYVDCYHANAMVNRPFLNRTSCSSDLYRAYVAPDRYYDAW
ncbi:MAG: hypothetical protein NVV74_25270 [Magnetospirillum sp.]|nr:hypothetical protein [Magnetospirillum sp.]